jgi:hypothetical protein
MLINLWCALFGHDWQVNGDGPSDIGSERNCRRCGRHWPAIVWPRSHATPGQSGDIKTQVIAASVGDTIVVTYEGALSAHQLAKVVENIKRCMSSGVKVLVLDSGAKLTHVKVTTVRPRPVIPQPK